jgi:hypothetical protein
LAEFAMRCRSFFKYSATTAVSRVTVSSSAGHRPPITHGVQSAGVSKVGMDSA